MVGLGETKKKTGQNQKNVHWTDLNSNLKYFDRSTTVVIFFGRYKQHRSIDLSLQVCVLLPQYLTSRELFSFIKGK